MSCTAISRVRYRRVEHEPSKRERVILFVVVVAAVVVVVVDCIIPQFSSIILESTR